MDEIEASGTIHSNPTADKIADTGGSISNLPDQDLVTCTPITSTDDAEADVVVMLHDATDAFTSQTGQTRNSGLQFQYIDQIQEVLEK